MAYVVLDSTAKSLFLPVSGEDARRRKFGKPGNERIEERAWGPRSNRGGWNRTTLLYFLLMERRNGY